VPYAAERSPTRGAASGSVIPEVSVENATERVGAPGQSRPLQRRRRRWWILVILGVTALVVVVLVAATLRFIVFPTQNQPRHVNGIVSFNGPDEGARTSLAVSLAEEGYAPVLLFSQGSKYADTPCPRASGVSVVCFIDASGNTRGEAEWAGGYAERHHWHSLLIVPGRGQATRARLLTERCFSGQVVVVHAVESRPSVSEIIHEWGGLFDALVVHRTC
jgi:hypothetical protein